MYHLVYLVCLLCLLYIVCLLRLTAFDTAFVLSIVNGQTHYTGISSGTFQEAIA